MKSFLALTAFAAAGLAVAAPAAAQRGPGPDPRNSQQADEARFETARQRFDREYQLFQQELRIYQDSRRNQAYVDPRDNGRWDDRDEGDYDAARYYRDGPRYRERALRTDERVYRGRDGKYYCKRDDGTTGLIVGAVAGGALGNVIDGGHSRTAGTLIGALFGAVVGQSIDKQNQEIRCR
ncbi:MAG: glycine zipper 2TM domain-containing protein [Sphingomonas sp.]